MKSDMAAYHVTELTPEEASGTSGGMAWEIAFGVIGLAGVLAVIIAEEVTGQGWIG
ncbi:hypothetical protein NXC14_PA00526 (plasmid) [Rhizobium sp. NXC14]|uniref:hypothetical protein n=1 Tax=Rhizobium sp. NXC14 TaxID=1981173 RepID=UPI000A201A85|nr:hypothetical protein [Rhizobium sp. NXC14]ARO32782.1 hypothetical protein NXC14_PA00526 [Rhizobium sp. NXC14]